MGGSDCRFQWLLELQAPGYSFSFYLFLPSSNFFFSIFLNLLFHKYLIFNFDFLISFFFTLGLILFFFFFFHLFVCFYLYIYIYCLSGVLRS